MKMSERDKNDTPNRQRHDRPTFTSTYCIEKSTLSQHVNKTYRTVCHCLHTCDQYKIVEITLNIFSYICFTLLYYLGLYGSLICNQCLSPLTVWVRIPLRLGVFDVIECDKVCQWLVVGRRFSLGTPVSSTNKT